MVTRFLGKGPGGMNEWHCLLCGVRLYGLRQQSAHMRNYNLNADDPSRCDNLRSHGWSHRCRERSSPINIIYEPDFNTNREVSVENVARVSLLTRRCSSESSGDKYMDVPIRRTVNAEVDAAPLDFCRIQTEWERCVTYIPY